MYEMRLWIWWDLVSNKVRRKEKIQVSGCNYCFKVRMYKIQKKIKIKEKKFNHDFKYVHVQYH